MKVFDETQVRKTISLLKNPGEWFEVRAIGNKITFSGYFDGSDALIEALNRDLYDFNGLNFYLSLNELDENCGAREQRNKFVKSPKVATSDNDVRRISWLFVDLDPTRPNGTSSTDEQLQKAKNKGNEIYKFLKGLGFENPIFAVSGNGVHMLYKCDLNTDADNLKTIEKCLKTLDMLFSDESVKVDVSNKNASRVCKLYGTMAQKGSNTKKNPHRASYIIGDVQPKCNGKAFLLKLCDFYVQEEQPQRYNNYRPRDFDLEEWLNRYNVRHSRTTFADGYKYILDECPFDSSHKGKDACLFKSRDGRIGFHCFHNSCADKKWRDFRILFEPDAYDKRNQEYEQRIYSKRKEPKPIVAVDGNPTLFSAMDIYNMPKKEETFVKTGFSGIDSRLRGLKHGYVSLMSGLRASGKSSIISQLCLNCVQDGYNVAVFSGELTPKNFMKWMNLQAAGKHNVKPTQYEGYYYVADNHRKEIAEWLNDHFWLYNNDYGNNFRAILDVFSHTIDEKNLDLLILDNLMAFDISDLSDNKWEAQTVFVLMLCELAKKKNTHILFVAHPRKVFEFLRLDDISGTADLGNAVDNAFIVHRNNNDFRRLSKQTLGLKDDNEIFLATNCIEIAKDRDNGAQDILVPLWYEPESKRLKSSRDEYVSYGWQEEDDFLTLDDFSTIPFD